MKPPAFNPFRPRVRVKLNPNLTLLCYAPSVDDGLKAERMIESADELRQNYDAARDVAVADEMRAQLWSLLVGAEITDEDGAPVPTPKDWRKQLESEGTLDGQFGAEAWGLLFRRQLAARLIGSAARRGSDSGGPAPARQGRRRAGADVPLGKQALSRTRVRPVP